MSHLNTDICLQHSCEILPNISVLLDFAKYEYPPSYTKYKFLELAKYKFHHNSIKYKFPDFAKYKFPDLAKYKFPDFAKYKYPPSSTYQEIEAFKSCR